MVFVLVLAHHHWHVRVVDDVIARAAHDRAPNGSESTTSADDQVYFLSVGSLDDGGTCFSVELLENVFHLQVNFVGKDIYIVNTVLHVNTLWLLAKLTL